MEYFAGLGPIGAGGEACYMQERDFEAEGWPELCPVLISMAGGFLFRLTEIGSSWLLRISKRRSESKSCLPQS
jgi:hypothetical protein